MGLLAQPPEPVAPGPASRVGERGGILGRDPSWPASQPGIDARRRRLARGERYRELPAPSLRARPLWVIVPTYNERDNIGPITEAILATVPAAHILIVDDGSPDGTGELADELAAEAASDRGSASQRPSRAWDARTWPRSATCWPAEPTSWSRWTPTSAIRCASCRRCSSRSPTDRADLVLGSRYVKGGQIPRWNILRRLVSRGGSVFAGVVLLMPYRDLTGGFKAFRATVLRAIDLDRLHAGGYAFQIETTFRARLAGARIVEMPITFEERRAGESKMSMAIFTEAFRLVLALRLRTLHRRRRQLPS